MHHLRLKFPQLISVASTKFMPNRLNDVLVLIFWVPKNNMKRKIVPGERTTVETFRHFFMEMESERDGIESI